jgi:hypothetical protein
MKGKKIMQFILNLANGNLAKIIAVIALIVLFVWLFGCQPMTSSLTDPSRQIPRAEVEAEIDSFMAIAKARLTDLDRQDEIQRLVLDKAALFATTGSFNATGLLNILVSIVAVGSAVDSRRKLNSALQKNAPTDTTNSV